MQLPQDPFILLGFINTKLRDQYKSLDALCEDLEINREKLETDLASIEYSYAKDLNQFIAV